MTDQILSAKDVISAQAQEIADLRAENKLLRKHLVLYEASDNLVIGNESKLEIAREALVKVDDILERVWRMRACLADARNVIREVLSKL